MSAPAVAAPGEHGHVRWRAVALPSEHGGWGLTAEPVLLGLAVVPSPAGLAIGVAAILAFLARTPLKLAAVDRRRGRSLPRTRVARWIGGGELLAVAVAGGLAVGAAGWGWTVAVAAALPLFAVEVWFDVRSRSRRLAPELGGAVGISAVAAAIALAGDAGVAVAMAMWLILAARSLAAIPFVRHEVARLHGRPTAAWLAWLPVAAGCAAVALTLEAGTAGGVLALGALGALQAGWSRRPVPPARVLGVRQLVAGLVVVAATAVGLRL